MDRDERTRVRAFAGLPEAVAVVREALRAHGVDLHPIELVELARAGATLTAFARCAEAHGIATRLCRLEPRDVDYLEAGDLVAFESGEIARVVDGGPGGSAIGAAGVAFPLGRAKAPVASLSLSANDAAKADERRTTRPPHGPLRAQRPARRCAIRSA